MNFKNIGLGILVASSVAIISCKDEDRRESPELQTETTTDSENTAALNPAHGAPGHRCDIPVGAPLSQASSANSVQQQQPNTTSTSVSPVRVNSDSAPMKNPPHGQPGHDCTVPVGADLNAS